MTSGDGQEASRLAMPTDEGERKVVAELSRRLEALLNENEGVVERCRFLEEEGAPGHVVHSTSANAAIRGRALWQHPPSPDASVEKP